MSLESAARLAMEFCEFAWRDVEMNDYAFERLERTIDDLRAALAESAKTEAQADAKPAAYVNGDGYITPLHLSLAPGAQLYLHPPRRESAVLSDEEMRDLVKESGLDWQRGYMPLFDGDETNRYAVLIEAVLRAAGGKE